MRILLSNDDGIHAEGLSILEQIAGKLSDDIWIVAPETEQSGASHSLTLHHPVRVRELAPGRVAISGTPTDCVLMAERAIVPVQDKRIDVVLSGVNCGSNAADDVTYSGTVAAAMEGTLLGIPSIALSQHYSDSGEFHWQNALDYAPDLIAKLIKTQWREDTFINLNFPACPPEQVKGVLVVPQGKRIMRVELHERQDPRARAYFWLGGERDNKANKQESDIAKLEEGYVTVTPIHMDMTDFTMLEQLREYLEE